MKKDGLAVSIAAVFGLGLVVGISSVQASMKEIKIYKEAYPDAKIKCIDCHKEAMPKKDDGQHELNDYGQAVIAEAQKGTAPAAVVEPAKEVVIPTADTYKAVGKIEDFVKKEEVKKPE